MIKKLLILFFMTSLYAAVSFADREPSLGQFLGLVPRCEIDQEDRVKRLAPAIEQVKEKLKEKDCIEYFDQYWLYLLEVGKGAPNNANKDAFHALLEWVVVHDVLAEQNARVYYTRYFGEKFTSLYHQTSTCSTVCPNYDILLADSRSELLDKEVGLSKISLDNKSYAAAQNLYQSFWLIMEATCEACGGRY